LTRRRQKFGGRRREKGTNRELRHSSDLETWKICLTRSIWGSESLYFPFSLKSYLDILEKFDKVCFSCVHVYSGRQKCWIVLSCLCRWCFWQVVSGSKSTRKLINPGETSFITWLGLGGQGIVLIRKWRKKAIAVASLPC
jgi:hypothetical protein